MSKHQPAAKGKRKDPEVEGRNPPGERLPEAGESKAKEEQPHVEASSPLPPPRRDGMSCRSVGSTNPWLWLSGLNMGTYLANGLILLWRSR